MRALRPLSLPLSLPLSALLLAGCATSSTSSTLATPSSATSSSSVTAPAVLTAAPTDASDKVALNHHFDYALHTQQGEPISLSTLAQQLRDFDVILVGEWHSHSGVHRLQADLFSQLYRENPHLALSMEQFTRDNQRPLNAYLEGKIGEQYFIKQANAWDNYVSDYRALVEFAKDKQLDVIAANAPRSITRCLGRQGADYLDKLDEEEKTWVAETLYMGDTPYKEKFMASMHHGSKEKSEKLYSAQLAWDETMAESIVKYLEKHPNTTVMHTAGSFHVEGGLGIAASILRRSPELRIATLVPVTEVAAQSSDYQIKVLNVPKRYVQEANMMAAFKSLRNRSKGIECK